MKFHQLIIFQICLPWNNRVLQKRLTAIGARRRDKTLHSAKRSAEVQEENAGKVQEKSPKITMDAERREGNAEMSIPYVRRSVETNRYISRSYSYDFLNKLTFYLFFLLKISICFRVFLVGNLIFSVSIIKNKNFRTSKNLDFSQI